MLNENETDPLTLRMIAAKKLNSCELCREYVNNWNSHPAKLSYCMVYPAMEDKIACMNYVRRY